MKKTLLTIQKKNLNNEISLTDLEILSFIYKLFFNNRIEDLPYLSKYEISNYIRKVIIKIQVDLKKDLKIINSYLTK